MGADAQLEWQVVPATAEVARLVADRMRLADALECQALGQDPGVAVFVSLANSTIAGAVLLHGELAGVFGAAASRVPSRGIVWNLTTPVVERHPRAFLRASRAILPVLLEAFPGGLFNFIDARCLGALRWAARLGFLIGPAESFGPLGMPFHCAGIASFTAEPSPLQERRNRVHPSRGAADASSTPGGR